MPNSLRAALYLRVSTDQQTTDNQRPELVALAKQREFTIEAVYDDTGSAVQQRPQFDRMRRPAGSAAAMFRKPPRATRA